MDSGLEVREEAVEYELVSLGREKRSINSKLGRFGGGEELLNLG
jgi:hypothetical protein